MCSDGSARNSTNGVVLTGLSGLIKKARSGYVNSLLWLFLSIIAKVTTSQLHIVIESLPLKIKTHFQQRSYLENDCKFLLVQLERNISDCVTLLPFGATAVVEV